MFIKVLSPASLSFPSLTAINSRELFEPRSKSIRPLAKNHRTKTKTVSRKAGRSKSEQSKACNRKKWLI
jgi:hypothetical protein